MNFDLGIMSTMHSTMKSVSSIITSIDSDLIPEHSRVVFDWDNTLKVIDLREKKTVCRVSKDFLQHLKEEKQCELYIISAIRPSQMNIDTLLTEVDRLGLKEFFCPKELSTPFGKRKEVRDNYHWVQEGNIIICGYDKAEVFKAVVEREHGKGSVNSRPAVIFDDEEVNIINFSSIIEGSLCYLVVNTDDTKLDVGPTGVMNDPVKAQSQAIRDIAPVNTEGRDRISQSQPQFLQVW